jgi:hypothetical protein
VMLLRTYMLLTWRRFCMAAGWRIRCHDALDGPAGGVAFRSGTTARSCGLGHTSLMQDAEPFLSLILSLEIGCVHVLMARHNKYSDPSVSWVAYSCRRYFRYRPPIKAIILACKRGLASSKVVSNPDHKHKGKSKPLRLRLPHFAQQTASP